MTVSTVTTADITVGGIIRVTTVTPSTAMAVIAVREVDVINCRSQHSSDSNNSISSTHN